MAKHAFSRTLISQLDGQLRSLPKIETKLRDLTKVESIRALANSIRAAQRNGYSLAEIAERLTASGLAISGNTLKNYLQQSRQPSKKKTTIEHRPAYGSTPQENLSAQNAQ
jgi:predicted transcriptional regulator